MEMNETTPESKNSQFAVWQFAGLLAMAFLIGIGVGYFVWGYPLQKQLVDAQLANQNAQTTITAASAGAQAANSAEQAQPTGTPEVVRYDVPVDDDPILGPSDAPITLIEFSDYECPFCQKWHVEVYPKLREKYGDKIRFVYRDFPLYGLHANADSAAEAAQCAGNQKKYWEFHELLFTGGKNLSRTTYLDYATTLGLNQTSFEKCLDDRSYQKEVEADYQYASELGIQSTPTFFINGLAVVGAQPFEVFERIIDMELAGEIPH